LGDAESMMYAQKLISTRDRRDIIATNLEEHLQAYDADATQHGLRVAEILQAMGRKLNLMDKEIDDLRLLARMHDIGKMVVEEASSSHRGGLDEKAYRQIRSYPDMGYRIAISSKTLFGIAEHILYQNEWWNGNGYPQGLQGEDIPLASRMLAVVNTFDVMTSGRPYRDPISREDAFEELRKCKGTQFDPYLVDMVISIIPEISVHSSEDD
jgi:HD-GYP domain-containing protein (c-di-GMP phosphodiesterase class II)